MSDPRRIVLATGIFPPDIGGPATYVQKLAGALVARGRDVRIVTYGDPRDAANSASGEQMLVDRITRVPRAQPILARYRAFERAVTQACSPDSVPSIIFAQDPLSSGLPAWRASRATGATFVLKIVGDLAWEIARSEGWVDVSIEAFQDKSYPPGRVWLARALERRVARRAEVVITPSRYLAELVSGWGVSAERLQVIHNGAEPIEESTSSEVRVALRQHLGGVGEDPFILSAGRLVPWKGFDRIIHSLARLLPDFPGLRLMIAGEGEQDAGLQALAERLGVGERVLFTGALRREVLASLMRRARALVLASSYEGLSHLLIEAMHCGVPIVASRNGGNPELIRHGRDGLLFDRDDPKTLDDCLENILEHEETARQFAKSAQHRAREFTWSRTLAETLSLLDTVSSRLPGSR